MSFWDDQAGYDIRDPKHPDTALAADGLEEAVVRKPWRMFWAWKCDCGQINSIVVSTCGRCGAPL